MAKKDLEMRAATSRYGFAKCPERLRSVIAKGAAEHRKSARLD
jgi:hypothetical protein